MASIKKLKKDINYVLGDVITYVLDLASLKNKTAEGEAIVDETITVFDGLIERLYADDISETKKHFKTIKVDLHNKAAELIEKANNL